jgi:hypothetical protein
MHWKVSACLLYNLIQETFGLEQAEEVNQQTAERVEEWQSLDSLPEGHNANLIEIGQRILKGHVGVLDIPVAPPIIKDTLHLLKEAKELENEEQRLKIEFPAATRIIDPVPESTPVQPIEAVLGNGHESEESEKSESSGVLVEQHDCEDSVDISSSTELGKPAETPAEILEETSEETPEEA